MGENVMNEKDGWNTNRGKPVRERKRVSCGRAAQRALRTASEILGAILLIGVMVSPLCAQSYPNQPIRFVVNFPPGGGTDFTARIIGPKLAERLGQPVVIENRAGGGGNVGAEFVAKARPDGYTIGIVTVDITPGPSLYKKLTYDPTKDFAPISLVAQNPLVFLVSLNLPVKNLKEFVEYAKANPGKINYGSSGMGGLGHLSGELLKSLAKINMVHAAYKGAGPALVGLVGGEIDMTVVSAASAMPHIQAGKARAFAVLGKERIASLPDVPTSKEAGVDNFEALYWSGILAPLGTPRDIINRLNGEWAKIAAMPDVIEQIRKGGLETVSGTAEQFSELMRAEVARWGKVIKEANIPSLD
jgi:tripartite-type tricarboxylate transporter receptor subunit TctC